MPKRIGSGIELLADPTRRRIVALIARRVHRPSRIAEELGLSRPAVSRQLRLLFEANLLEAHGYPADRRSIAYHLNPLMAARMIAWLAGTEVGLEPTRPSPDLIRPPLPLDLARIADSQAPVDGDERAPRDASA